MLNKWFVSRSKYDDLLDEHQLLGINMDDIIFEKNKITIEKEKLERVLEEDTILIHDLDCDIARYKYVAVPLSMLLGLCIGIWLN